MPDQSIPTSGRVVGESFHKKKDENKPITGTW